MKTITKRVNLSRLALLALLTAVLMIPLSAEAHAGGVSLTGFGTATIDGMMGAGQFPQREVEGGAEPPGQRERKWSPRQVK